MGRASGSRWNGTDGHSLQVAAGGHSSCLEDIIVNHAPRSYWQTTSCLCSCHYGFASCDLASCARSAAPAASAALFVADPRETALASAHRTPSTPLPVFTPLGVSSHFTQ
jgi:hypothetical protein